jgi:hypothetical protein
MYVCVWRAVPTHRHTLVLEGEITYAYSRACMCVCASWCVRHGVCVIMCVGTPPTASVCRCVGSVRYTHSVMVCASRCVCYRVCVISVCAIAIAPSCVRHNVCVMLHRVCVMMCAQPCDRHREPPSADTGPTRELHPHPDKAARCVCVCVCAHTRRLCACMAHIHSAQSHTHTRGPQKHLPRTPNSHVCLGLQPCARVHYVYTYRCVPIRPHIFTLAAVPLCVCVCVRVCACAYSHAHHDCCERLLRVGVARDGGLQGRQDIQHQGVCVGVCVCDVWMMGRCMYVGM